MACVVVTEAVLTASTTRAVPANEVDSHGHSHQGIVCLFQSMLLACCDHMLAVVQYLDHASYSYYIL